MGPKTEFYGVDVTAATEKCPPAVDDLSGDE